MHLAYIAARGGEPKIESYIVVRRNALNMSVIDYSCFYENYQICVLYTHHFLVTAKSCLHFLAL